MARYTAGATASSTSGAQRILPEASIPKASTQSRKAPFQAKWQLVSPLRARQAALSPTAGLAAGAVCGAMAQTW